MKILKRKIYAITCNDCAFKHTGVLEEDLQERIEDHLNGQNHVGYKNGYHVVHVEKATEYTLDWDDSGRFQR